MSARDSESGSSSYRGGSGNAGGLGNGGVGGGMGGGHRGGGAGYNGGIGSRTGMTTGKDWYGNTAFGPAGGRVQAFGMRDARSLGRAGMGPTVGSFGNFRTPSGQAMFGNSPVQGQSFRGMNMGQALSQANRAQARQASVPGLLGGSPVASGAPASAVEQEMALPEYTPVPGPWTPQDPMAVYTTLTPPPLNPLVDVQPGLPPLDEMDVPGVPAPPTAPTSQYWGVRNARPSAITNAISAPDRNYRNNQTVSNYSYANDPSLGTSPWGGLGRYK
jgi:hypothetical protein